MPSRKAAYVAPKHDAMCVTYTRCLKCTSGCSRTCMLYLCSSADTALAYTRTDCIGTRLCTCTHMVAREGNHMTINRSLLIFRDATFLRYCCTAGGTTDYRHRNFVNDTCSYQMYSEMILRTWYSVFRTALGWFSCSSIIHCLYHSCRCNLLLLCTSVL